MDAARFDSLVAQVESLTKALAEQAQLNKQLQEQLHAVLSESADLRRRLQAASKRSRSPPATTSSGSPPPSTEAPSIDEEEEQNEDIEEDPASRRRSPGRVSPPKQKVPHGPCPRSVWL